MTDDEDSGDARGVPVGGRPRTAGRSSVFAELLESYVPDVIAMRESSFILLFLSPMYDGAASGGLRVLLPGVTRS